YKAEKAVQKINEELEKIVEERTNQLVLANHKIEQAFFELQHTQSQLVQTEKMSSLGQLVAGVAHEINNPVNFIYGNLIYVKEYTHDMLELLELYAEEYAQPSNKIAEKIEDIELDFLQEDLPKMLNSMEVGAERITEIVKSLRNFSRMDEAEMKPVNIHEGIDSTLMILHNRLKAKPEHPSIEIIKDYDKLPLIECYAGHLNQVFMNLISNAIDAIDEYNHHRSYNEIKANPSQIKITTRKGDNDKIIISIADNGPGMNAENVNKIFDPFFTTKPIGKGTGLGLAISYQIVVEKHGGKLTCMSESGSGAEFLIEIPVSQVVSKVA
ncbi:MAG TPA: ATP-binding protein, partial [Allocoleopsis sp.]